MKILVINSGSSSVKYQLFSLPGGKVLSKGLVERIGLDDTVLHHYNGEMSYDTILQGAGHAEAIRSISEILLDSRYGSIRDNGEIAAVGHRVVHGGAEFNRTVIITPEVKKKIRELFSLAPLHNPPNLTGIELAENIFPGAVQVAVFDTAFHRSIPPVAHRYALPAEYYEKYGIRVYGFHGTSHEYVTRRVRELTPDKSNKIISIHLGNGCSMTAVKDGKSIDHSLGFGPMNGLIMGTRSGDIDQAVILYLMDKTGMGTKEINRLLQKKSGLQGLTGTSDMREVEEAARNGDASSVLALEMVSYRIRKYIGAYTAVMNGLDALVFTAGIGEHSPSIREMSCRDMNYLGITLDKRKNQQYRTGEEAIEKEGTAVKIWVIPTNEEWEIARQTYELVSSQMYY